MAIISIHHNLPLRPPMLFVFFDEETITKISHCRIFESYCHIFYAIALFQFFPLNIPSIVACSAAVRAFQALVLKVTVWAV